MRNIRHFWVYLVIFLGLLFLFLTNDFGLSAVQSTAIITGLAIDKEDDELVLTADLAIPSSSKQGENTSPLQVSGKGKTVAEALERIGGMVGWSPKLVYCHLLLLGEDAVQEDVFQYLDYFLRNEYFSDNCIVVCTEGKASEIFSVQTPVDNIVSLALQKILSGEAYATGRCSSVQLKDFAIGYYGETKSGFMPIVKATAPTQSAANTSDDSKQSQGNEKSKQDQQVFSVSTTALFYKGVKREELSEAETFAMNLLRVRLRSSAYTVQTEEGNYCIDLKSNSDKLDFRVEEGVPKLDLNVKVRASISDKSEPSTLHELSTSTLVPTHIKKKIETDLEASYESVFEKCQRTNCDVFRIVEKLKRNENDYFEAYKKDILRLTKPSFQVTVTSSRY